MAAPTPLNVINLSSQSPDANGRQFSVGDDAFSDSEVEADANVAEVKPLISPSKNIAHDLEALVQDGFHFNGAFAFSERERDALAIIATSASIPVSRIDPRPSGGYEIAGEKVRFDNPAWPTWLQVTAGSAATVALTTYHHLRPNFVLKKLVVHGPSAHTTRHRESAHNENSNLKIGDLIVVLPGAFEGAELQLRHGSQKKVLNLSHQSGLTTSVVAAYTGVEHTLAGVTSGYRTTLLYDIVPAITATAFRPILPEMHGSIQRLRNILLSWQQNRAQNLEDCEASGENDANPGQIACLLRHRYKNEPGFSSKSLKGADALLVAHLRPLAKDLRFRLFIAHYRVTMHISVSRNSYQKGYGWKRRSYHSYSDEGDDADLGVFEEGGVDEIESHLLGVADLQGMPVSIGGLEKFFYRPDNIINGGDKLGEDEPDSSDFERLDRVSADRTNYFNRTALVILPPGTEPKVSIGNIYDFACTTLEASFSAAPTAYEKRLIDNLLLCCTKHRQEDQFERVVRVVREAADRWDDVGLLIRALTVCDVDKNTSLLGVEGFVSCYQAFGWDGVGAFISKAATNDTSNTRRQALISRLARMGEEEEENLVITWCQVQTDLSLRSLSKMDASQIPWLSEVALSRGGAFLRDVIFPQLEKQDLDKSFWVPFIPHLQRGIEADSDSRGIITQLINRCVSELVRNLPAFPIKSIAAVYSYMARREDKAASEILEVVKLCVDMGCDDLCTGIFDKMREAATKGEYNLTFPPWMYYSELSGPMITLLDSRPQLRPIMLSFFAGLVDSMISGARSVNGKAVTPCPLTDAHKAVIIAAVRKAGGLEFLQPRVTPALLTGQDSSTLQELIRFIIKERLPLKTQSEKEAHGRIIITIVRMAIKSANLYPQPLTHYSYYASSNNPVETAMSLVKLCFETGARVVCKDLFQRLLAPPTKTTIAEHTSEVLVPFLRNLKTYLRDQKVSMESGHHLSFAISVLRLFAEHTMTEKPVETVSVARLSAIGCTACHECRELKAFFLSDRTTISFARVQAIRKHLEKQLYVTGAWGVTWDTIRVRSPHALKIDKPPSMTALGPWNANSEQGQAALAVLGDAAAQERLLGADYAWIYGRIHGTYNGPVPVASAATKRPADDPAGALKKKAKTA
ncbi:unnamed protein product [Mycena citricolor]|uniref:Uncharacterized protein n=1 Tax=Mycena citricolor TaxID=2018698 RepID=A0AAD2K529_9AGAR|nr:unnamed protein product [Mycena citricolor]